MSGYMILVYYIVSAIIFTVISLTVILLYNSFQSRKSKTEDLEDRINRKLNKMLDRKGIGSVLFYYWISYLISVFAIPIGIYVAEALDFWPTEKFGHITNGAGVPTKTLWAIIPVGLIVWLLLLIFLFTGTKNLVNLFVRKTAPK